MRMEENLIKYTLDFPFAVKIDELDWAVHNLLYLNLDQKATGKIMHGSFSQICTKII